MRSVLLSMLLLLAAVSLSAGEDAVVANVNGEPITRAKLDVLWERAGEPMRAQYERNGGKRAFLDNYIRKLLLLQDAASEGFERAKGDSPEQEAVSESQLFDLYVREVIAPSVVTSQDVRKFYDENPSQFLEPEQVKVKAIFISSSERGKTAAREVLAKVMTELHPLRAAAADSSAALPPFLSAFGEAARRYSEDTSAAGGGDLGWLTREKLGPELADAVFAMPAGAMSGMIDSEDGYHLFVIEAQKPASREPFEQVSGAIREFLLSRNTAKILEAINEASIRLSLDGKVEIFPDNLE